MICQILTRKYYHKVNYLNAPLWPKSWSSRTESEVEKWLHVPPSLWFHKPRDVTFSHWFHPFSKVLSNWKYNNSIGKWTRGGFALKENALWFTGPLESCLVSRTTTFLEDILTSRSSTHHQEPTHMSDSHRYAVRWSRLLYAVSGVHGVFQLNAVFHVTWKKFHLIWRLSIHNASETYGLNLS